MRSYQQHIWNLVTRILSGEAGPAEEKQFTRWLDEDPSNWRFSRSCRPAGPKSPTRTPAYQSFLFDRESAASRLRYKLREEKQKHAIPRGFFTGKELQQIHRADHRGFYPAADGIYCCWGWYLYLESFSDKIYYVYR